MSSDKVFKKNKWKYRGFIYKIDDTTYLFIFHGDNYDISDGIPISNDNMYINCKPNQIFLVYVYLYDGTTPVKIEPLLIHNNFDDIFISIIDINSYEIQDSTTVADNLKDDKLIDEFLDGIIELFTLIEKGDS